MATHLRFVYKYIYDYRVHFALMIKDNGNAGIIINFRDEFNYYGLEFSTWGNNNIIIETAV